MKEGHFAKVCCSSRRRSSSSQSCDVIVNVSFIRISVVVCVIVQEYPETLFVGYLRIDSCKESPQSCWWKQFTINNTPVRCKFDTGAEANVMSRTVFQSLSQAATAPSRVISSYSV